MSYPIMRVSRYDDEMIPKLATHAFRHAFQHACAVSQVVYVKDHQMLQRNIDGHEVVLKDVSQAYIPMGQLPKTLKRKKHEVTV
ncbi:hypothetical protein [Acinetobacter sp. ANC 4178]|uniref:hypothetical protein n=1 Tax=Acinetobacter sp. ANC 4178 TaxID=2529839 RepID=UPI00103C4218|nr:hypothetical protein [Acinetobacter sp. ANC 4178]TCB66421.1 hypothetical protein E0H87_10165 [Acinetobacter sp. ANC 4178]